MRAVLQSCCPSLEALALKQAVLSFGRIYKLWQNILQQGLDWVFESSGGASVTFAVCFGHPCLTCQRALGFFGSDNLVVFWKCS